MIKKRRKKDVKPDQAQCMRCKISLMATIVYAVLAGILVYLSLETVRIKDRKTMQSLRYSQAQYLEQLNGLEAKLKIYENVPADSFLYISDPVKTANGEVYISQDRDVDIYFQNGQTTKLLQTDVPANPNGINPPVLTGTNSPNIVELTTIAKTNGSNIAHYYINTDNYEIISTEIVDEQYLDIETSLKKIRVEPWINCNSENKCIIKGFLVNDKQVAGLVNSDITFTSNQDPTSDILSSSPLTKIKFLGMDINLENVYFNFQLINPTDTGDQIIKDTNLKFNLTSGSITKSEPDFLLKPSNNSIPN